MTILEIIASVLMVGYIVLYIVQSVIKSKEEPNGNTYLKHDFRGQDI